MTIPAFRFANQRGISLAECTSVPSLMLIAGPNGCGKSTLLNLLRDPPGSQARPLYIGPHRFARRESISYQNLLYPPVMLDEVLADHELKPRSGHSITFTNRTPWNTDEGLSFVRYCLCQIEYARKEAISARYDKDSQIAPGSLPDPWEPLRELTGHLLPHLQFSRIDVGQQSEVKCLWRVHNRTDFIDLDDLSSGEKTVVQMFFPFVQRRMHRLLATIPGEDAASDIKSATLIVDEPELHLHPQLQIKTFDYFRYLVAVHQMQVILATQSATLVEYATSDELYLMRPTELVGPQENQLLKIASDQHRLDALRSLYGTMSNLTSMQPIIVVEGSENKKRSVPDRRLYRMLHSSFDKIVVVCGGGKGECIKLRQVLHQALGELSKSLRAIALLDRDTSEGDTDANVFVLPVSVIENFLVDPETIWETIQSIIDKTPFHSVADVEKALDQVLSEQAATETERIVIQSLKAATFRAHAPTADIENQLRFFVETTRNAFHSDTIASLTTSAQSKVDSANKSKKRREYFDGKQVLDTFYKSHLHNTGMSKEIFHFELARHARRRKSVTQFFDALFQHLLPDDKLTVYEAE